MTLSLVMIVVRLVASLITMFLSTMTSNAIIVGWAMGKGYMNIVNGEPVKISAMNSSLKTQYHSLKAFLIFAGCIIEGIILLAIWFHP